jgi:hypothetical protein
MKGAIPLHPFQLLIKNQLSMKTQMRPTKNIGLRKIAVISLFLLLGNILGFSQENQVTGNSNSAIKNGWWNPIFNKHNIDLDKFNYKNIINLGMKDTTEFTLTLEMGNSDSLNSRVIPYEDAIFISKGAGQTYWIITSEFAQHDLDNNLLILRNGQLSCYDFISPNVIPTDTSSFQEMSIDIRLNKIEASSK